MRIIFLLSLIFILSGARSFYPVNQAEIEVVLNNIKNARGVFVISFYNDAKSFPKPGKDAFTEKVRVNDTMARSVKFKLPAAGWYAIAMFQDEDESGKIKQDKIGYLLEAYAFSNNVRPKLAAPGFAACKFYVSENNNSPFIISLIQPKIGRKK